MRTKWRTILVSGITGAFLFGMTGPASAAESDLCRPIFSDQICDKIGQTGDEAMDTVAAVLAYAKGEADKVYWTVFCFISDDC